MSMGRGAWDRTPYSSGKAKTPDASITTLLEKYGVVEHQITNHRGPNGRPAITVRFVLRGRGYRFSIETLDAKDIEPEKLVKQVKRVIYWTLKPTLETLLVFMPPEQALLPFLEDASGQTVYEGLAKHLPKLTSQGLDTWARSLPALPAPE